MDDIRVGEDVEELEHLYIAGGNIKWYSHFGKVWQLLKKLNKTYYMIHTFYS